MAVLPTLAPRVQALQKLAQKLSQVHTRLGRVGTIDYALAFDGRLDGDDRSRNSDKPGAPDDHADDPGFISDPASGADDDADDAGFISDPAGGGAQSPDASPIKPAPEDTAGGTRPTGISTVHMCIQNAPVAPALKVAVVDYAHEQKMMLERSEAEHMHAQTFAHQPVSGQEHFNMQHYLLAGSPYVRVDFFRVLRAQLFLLQTSARASCHPLYDLWLSPY